MRVIGHEPQGWFLLEEDGSLFLATSCEHSFVGYDFLLQLDTEELRTYEREGRAFISHLATEIQYSAPIARGSTSRFKNDAYHNPTRPGSRRQSGAGGQLPIHNVGFAMSALAEIAPSAIVSVSAERDMHSRCHE
jgi:hypothetical protein